MLTHSIIVHKPPKNKRKKNRAVKDNDYSIPQKLSSLRSNITKCPYKPGDHVETVDNGYGCVIDIAVSIDDVVWAGLRPLYIVVYCYETNEEFLYHHNDLKEWKPQ